MYGFEITATGVSLKDYADILTDRKQDWVDAFALSNQVIDMSQDHTPQGQIAMTESAIINDRNAQMLELFNMLSYKTAKGNFLYAFGEYIGVDPKPIIPTSQEVRCYGLAGTQLIGKGSASPSKVADTNERLYTARSNYVIPNNGTGYIDAMFDADDGFIDGTPIAKIITTTPGWDTAETISIISGQGKETDSQYRVRYEKEKEKNASGSVGACVGAILEFSDVLLCVGRDNRNSINAEIDGYNMLPNSQAYSVLGGTNENIIATIAEKSSVAVLNGNTTATYTSPSTGQVYNNGELRFIRPTDTPFYFKVTGVSSDSLPSNAADLVKNAIYNEFYYGEQGRVDIAEDVYNSRFYVAVMGAVPTLNLTEPILMSIDNINWSYHVKLNLDQVGSVNKDNIQVTIS